MQDKDWLPRQGHAFVLVAIIGFAIASDYQSADDPAGEDRRWG